MGIYRAWLRRLGVEMATEKGLPPFGKALERVRRARVARGRPEDPGVEACHVGDRLGGVVMTTGRLRIPQRKTRGSLWLPLTDEVGTTLLDYLRHGRHALNVRRQRVPFRGEPPRSYRELFLRCRTPTGVLKPTAVTEAFQAWSKRSGLAIPFQGPHCLRHSYAVHLLRSGLSLKTIGDLLGHRNLESTGVYLRLAVDDLRDVALPLPAEVDRRAPGVAS